MLELIGWGLVGIAGLTAVAAGAMARNATAERDAAEAACPAIGAFLEIDAPGGAGRMHYVERGRALEGTRPVVLIHGMGGSLRHFSSTILDDLERDHRVIAVDRPGSGYSRRPSSGSETLAGQAAYIRAGLKMLEVEQPVLVGHSFGGSVALAYALAHPEEVAALVLLAPATRPFSAKPPFRDDVVTSGLMRRILAWTIAIPTAKKARDAAITALFAPQSEPEDLMIAGGGLLAYRPSQVIANLEDLAVYQQGLAAMTTEYSRLTLPIAVLFGTEDGILDPEEHDAALRDVAQDVTVRMLGGIGHMLAHATPDRVTETIRLATRL